MRDAIAEMEKAEPVAWLNVWNNKDVSISKPKHIPSDWFPVYTNPKLTPEGWVRAVDEEMVVCHLGVANESDDYETARKKLHELIQWHINVTLNPAVNGGWQLVPVEPTVDMTMAGYWSASPDPTEESASWTRAIIWKRMLAAAPKPEDV